MYGLPKTFESSFLHGKTVEQICFLQYQINIYLDGEIWIQTEGQYKLIRGNSSIETIDEFPVIESALPQLIGETVIDISFVIDTGDITLVFTNGLKLSIVGDIGPYESYRLYDGKNEIIV